MSCEWIDRLEAAHRSVGAMAAALLFASVAGAQAQQPDRGPWRIAAASGAYVPFSSLIRAGDSDDTGIAAGPAVSLEAQYQVSAPVAAYVNGTLAFGTLRLGSSIQPAVVGPSDQAMLVNGTVGVVLTTSGLFGETIQPTLRVGGGIKWYSFDLTDAENQMRPTGDIGLGFRGAGVGPLEVTAEVRYLPSSFDQSTLPTRGIAPQDQHQNDLVFSIGFGIRTGAGRGM